MYQRGRLQKFCRPCAKIWENAAGVVTSPKHTMTPENFIACPLNLPPLHVVVVSHTRLTTEFSKYSYIIC